MDPYNSIIGTVVSVLHKYCKLEKSAKDFGTGELLYPLEIHIIEIIGKNNEIKMMHLTEKMGITKSAISQVIKKMERKGYVVKFRDMKDSKGYYVKLRSKGETVFAQHQKVVENITGKIKAIIKDIPEKEIVIVHQAFKQLENEFDGFLK